MLDSNNNNNNNNKQLNRILNNEAAVLESFISDFWQWQAHIFSQLLAIPKDN